MKREVRRKGICFLVALIMAFTCTGMTAFAVEGESASDEAVAAGAGTEEGVYVTDEDVLPSIEESSEEAQAPAVIAIKVEPGEDNAATVSWSAINGAVKYLVKYGDNSIEVTEGTSCQLEGYAGEAITVEAYDADGVLIGAGESAVVSAAEVGEFTITAEQEKMTMVVGQPNKTTYKKYSGSISSYNPNYTPDGTYTKEVVVDRPVTISWAVYPEAAYYELYKADNDGEFVKIVTLNDEGAKSGAYKVSDFNMASPSFVDKKKTEMYQYYESYNAETKTFEAEKPAGKEYLDDVTLTYQVKAFDVNGVELAASEASDPAVVPAFISSEPRTIGWHVKAKVKTKLYKSRKGSKAICSISKGTKAKIDYRKPYRSYVIITSGTYKGKKGWMIRSKIGPDGGQSSHWNGTSGCAEYVTDKDWSKTTKENFVNKTKKWSGSNGCLIWVSRYTQKINIFKGSKGNFKLVRVCDCSTGNYKKYTGAWHKKIYKILTVTRRKGTKNEYTYEHANRFYLENAIHAPCYYKKGGVRATPKSKVNTLGCVRTWSADAYFVRYVCKKGAMVRCY